MKKFLNRFVGFIYEPVCFIKAKRYIKERNKWPSIQKQELVDLLYYAKKHCDYYKRILDGVSINKNNALDTLRNMPFLDKATIRTQNVQSDEITSDWKVWANTGGSTGEPLRFPRKSSSNTKRWEHINQMMLYIMMGYRVHDKIVVFDGLRISDEDLKNHKYFLSGNRNFPYGKTRYSVLYLGKDTVGFYVDALNREKPAFIRSYPTGMLLFCKLVKDNNLILNFKPKGVYLTSENFSQQDKDYISDVLGCPVWGQYGHTETSVFAIQKPDESKYLCSPIYGVTEVIDGEGKQVKAGEVGNLIVTGFNNYGLPFIRYQTGDMAEYGGIEYGGVTVLNKLMGRDTDFVYDNKNNKVFLVGTIFGAHMHAFDCINSWQIIQNRIGEIDMKIVKGASFDDKAEKELVSFFETNGLKPNLQFVDAIEKTKSGKQKFLIQRINTN